MVKIRTLGLLLTGLLLLSLSTWTAAQTACPDSLPARLTSGAQARVVPGDPNNVRDQASRAGALLGQIPGGETFTVLEGPVCADGFTWWRVDYNGLVGWTVEGAGQAYGLEPVGSAPVADAFRFPASGYPDVRFILPAEAGSDATGSLVIPALDDGSGTVPVWDVAPETLLIYLEGYPTELEPRIRIMPREAYTTLTGTDLTALETLLNDQPDPAEVPGFHLVGVQAPRALYGRTRFLDFAGGAGIRFVGYYTFDTSAITETGLSYVFVGLTNDSSYIIQAVLPITNTFSQDIPYDPANFDAYVTAASEAISNASRTAFTPNLLDLDMIFASMEITTANTASVEFTLQEATCSGFPTRLSAGQYGVQALSEDPLSLRDAPGGSLTNENIFPGDIVRVLAGPECAAGLDWWQVESVDSGFSGWVAESFTEYFFSPATATFTPTLTRTLTLTMTPTITLTPSQTFTPRPTITPGPSPTPTRTNTPLPTATLISGRCRIFPLADTNMRVAPDGEAQVAGYVRANAAIYVDAQFSRAGEGFVWWRLADATQVLELNGRRGGRWVREDFVTEEGACSTLPESNR